jgi:type II secretory pathway pseudopilin PulG
MARPSRRPFLRDDSGFSMIELLVGASLSVVVLAALASVLAVTFDQSSRISAVVTSNQIGRTAMSRVVEELHSSCTGFGGYQAIQKPEGTVSSPLSALNGNNLWFISTYGSATASAIVSSEGYEHDINWTKTKEVTIGIEKRQLGTLTDYAFKGTFSEVTQKWTFPELNPEKLTTSQLTTHILAENVIAPTTTNELFTYYKYNNSGTTSKLEALATSTEAQKATTESEGGIAAVHIEFTQAPNAIETAAGHTAQFSNEVLLRFNAVESGSEGINKVCA